MDLLNSIPLVGPVLYWVLPFVVVLSIVVAIHELGHLMVGRWCGIKAEVYSIGFGRVLWSRTDKHGTVWQVALLPFGGFVKFLGDMDPASAGRADEAEIAPEDRPRAFHNAALWKRTLTVLAGPVANFILSILIFFFLAMQVGKPSDVPVIESLGELDQSEIGFMLGDRVLRIGDKTIEKFHEVTDALFLINGAPTDVTVERDGREVTFTTTYLQRARVTHMEADGAALGAGMRPGDIIQSIDGTPMKSARDVQLIVADLPHNKEISFTVIRDGETREFAFTPKLVERKHPKTQIVQPIPLLGVGMEEVNGLSSGSVSVTFVEASYYAVRQVWRIIRDTVVFINQMLFHGADTSQLSGPIGIAKHSTNAANQGGLHLIQFVAFVSTAIGLFNLFPIPILDGGHLCFYAIEAIRRKPNNDTVVKYSTMAGLSLLLLLMVFVTFNNDLGLGELLSQN